MRETWLSENQRLVSQVGLMFQTHPGWWGGMGDKQSQGRVPAEGPEDKTQTVSVVQETQDLGAQGSPRRKDMEAG